jgi:hypothetical protein
MGNLFRLQEGCQVNFSYYCTVITTTDLKPFIGK